MGLNNQIILGQISLISVDLSEAIASSSWFMCLKWMILYSKIINSKRSKALRRMLWAFGYCEAWVNHLPTSMLIAPDIFWLHLRPWIPMTKVRKILGFLRSPPYWDQVPVRWWCLHHTWSECQISVGIIRWKAHGKRKRHFSLYDRLLHSIPVRITKPKCQASEESLPMTICSCAITNMPKVHYEQTTWWWPATVPWASQSLICIVTL